jgi:hypothetical protein
VSFVTYIGYDKNQIDDAEIKELWVINAAQKAISASGVIVSNWLVE